MQRDGQITLEEETETHDREFVLPSQLVSFYESKKNVKEEKFIPSVIEPSYGIGRILYCIYEHCFRIREQD
jgi:glycyl-tRNA synthetase